MMALIWAVLMGTKPFTAEFQEVKYRAGERQVSSGVMMADGEGRTRQELRLTKADGSVSEVVFVTDTRQGLVAMVDQKTGVVLSRMNVAKASEAGAVSGASTIGSMSQPAPANTSAVTDLGRREIQGIDCSGTRTDLPDGTVIEVWRSEALAGERVRHLVHKGVTLEYEFQLNHIRLDPPDPRLFAAVK
jgi:hypothetical protein